MTRPADFTEEEIGRTVFEDCTFIERNVAEGEWAGTPHERGNVVFGLHALSHLTHGYNNESFVLPFIGPRHPAYAALLAKRTEARDANRVSFIIGLGLIAALIAVAAGGL